jgi:hypothetical protein
VAAFGQGKREAMRRALAPADDSPAARLIRQARAPLVLMDAAAGEGWIRPAPAGCSDSPGTDWSDRIWPW